MFFGPKRDKKKKKKKKNQLNGASSHSMWLIPTFLTPWVNRCCHTRGS